MVSDRAATYSPWTFASGLAAHGPGPTVGGRDRSAEAAHRGTRGEQPAFARFLGDRLPRPAGTAAQTRHVRGSSRTGPRPRGSHRGRLRRGRAAAVVPAGPAARAGRPVLLALHADGAPARRGVGSGRGGRGAVGGVGHRGRDQRHHDGAGRSGRGLRRPDAVLPPRRQPRVEQPEVLRPGDRALRGTQHDARARRRAETADFRPGIGFDPGERQTIFDPFRRLNARSAYQGSGLGLSICRAIVERHGWTISVDAAPGAGARFEIAIPPCDVL